MKLKYQGQDILSFGKIETRQQTGFDAVVDLIVREAKGEISFDDVFQLALVQSGIGLWRLAFSLGEPSESAETISPGFLGDLIEALITKGEAGYQIELNDDGGITLLPFASWTVEGSPDPKTWIYKAQIAGPDKTLERNLTKDRVLHITWSQKPGQSWKGSGPIEQADISSKLAAVSQSKLLQEVSGVPVGALLPVAGDPANEKFNPLKQALKTLKGKLSLVESKTSSYSAPGQGHGSNKEEWTARRLGANPPETLIGLCKDIELNCLSAIQVPRDLITGEVDGTALRESWRRFAIQVKAVGRRVAGELARDLDLKGLRFDWTALSGPDVAQRARAFSALRKAGMEAARAEEYALQD